MLWVQHRWNCFIPLLRGESSDILTLNIWSHSDRDNWPREEMLTGRPWVLENNLYNFVNIFQTGPSGGEPPQYIISFVHFRTNIRPDLSYNIKLRAGGSTGGYLDTVSAGGEKSRLCMSGLARNPLHKIPGWLCESGPVGVWLYRATQSPDQGSDLNINTFMDLNLSHDFKWAFSRAELKMKSSTLQSWGYPPSSWISQLESLWALCRYLHLTQTNRKHNPTT